MTIWQRIVAFAHLERTVIVFALITPSCVTTDIPIRGPRFVPLLPEADAVSTSKCTSLWPVGAVVDVGDSAARHATAFIFLETLEPAEQDVIAKVRARAAAYGANYLRLDRMTWVHTRTDSWMVVRGTAFLCAASAPLAPPRLKCIDDHSGLRTCTPLQTPDHRVSPSLDD